MTPINKLNTIDLIQYFEQSCQPRMMPYNVEIGGVIYGYFSLKQEIIERLDRNSKIKIYKKSLDK